MINFNDERTTAKQYINGRFESYISMILDCVAALETDEDIMDDEKFYDAFYWFHTEASDLEAMTLNERKQVIRQLDKQGERLLKIVDPK